MSSRQTRRLLGQDPAKVDPVAADDDEEDISHAPAARANAFGLLAAEDTAPPSAPRGDGAQRGARRRKKGGGAGAATHISGKEARSPAAPEPATGEGRRGRGGRRDGGLADLDQVLQELGPAPASAAAAAAAGVDLGLAGAALAVPAAMRPFLNVAHELRQHFGSRQVPGARRSSRFLLTDADPPASAGMSLRELAGQEKAAEAEAELDAAGVPRVGWPWREHLAAPDVAAVAAAWAPAGRGARRFRVEGSARLSAAGEALRAARASGDPARLVGIAHPDALLALFDACRAAGAFERCGPLAGQCLAMWETALGPAGLEALLRGAARLSPRPPLHLSLLGALLRQTQLALRQGCPRTALQLARLALAAAPADPRHLLLLADHAALRARDLAGVAPLCYLFQPLHHLPGLPFSLALAARMAEEDRGQNHFSGPFSVCWGPDPSSRRLLVAALRAFPCLGRAVLEAVAPQAAALRAPLLARVYGTGELDQLTRLYVARNLHMWKEDLIPAWLEAAAEEAAQAGPDPAQDARLRLRYPLEGRARQEQLPPGEAEEDGAAPLDAAQYTDQVDVLPGLEDPVAAAARLPQQLEEEDLRRALLEEAALQELAAAPPVVRADTDNALALFLSSLLPWRPVPTAPAPPPPPPPAPQP